MLINLKDIGSGGSVRRERRVRDAQRSAEQFAAALLELLQLRDTNPLLSFLAYCEIRLAGSGRLSNFAREPLTPGMIQAELRPLGERNLREYASLHEAALGFCQRHIARLARHAQVPTIDSVAGCMHIVRSVAAVLVAQIERLLTGLQYVTQVTADDWYAYRVKLDQLLGLWIALLRVVHLEWLLALAKTYDAYEIKMAIQPDLEPLRELARLFTDVRSRVVEATTRFYVQTQPGARVTPPIYPDNTIHQAGWGRWSDEVRGHQEALEAFGN